MSLTFTTTSKKREHRPVTVDLVGQEITVQWPKEATRWFASGVTAESASQPERAASMMQFLQATLDPADWQVIHHRATDRDDPLTFNAVAEMVSGLVTRWDDWDHAPAGALTITEHPSALPDGQESVTLEVDGHEITAHPPKDLLVFLVVGMMGEPSEQSRGMATFLDGSLDRGDRVWVEDRLRDQHDDFDLSELTEITETLLERWYPQPVNRAERRATSKNNGTAGRARANSGGSKRAPARSR